MWVRRGDGRGCGVDYLPERVVVPNGVDELAHERVLCWCRDGIYECRRDSLIGGSFVSKEPLNSKSLHTWLIVYSNYGAVFGQYCLNHASSTHQVYTNYDGSGKQLGRATRIHLHKGII